MKPRPLAPKDITPPSVNVFHEQFGWIARLNEYEFIEYRTQIKQAAATGYYVVLPNGDRANINTNGQLDTWPPDLFPEMHSLLRELLNFPV